MLDLFNTVFRYKENKSPDKLGKYPEAIHTLAFPERRYLWTSRLFVIFSCISISLNLILVSTIFLMTPQRSSSPLLLQNSKQLPQLSIVERNEKNIAAMDLLVESMLEEYIYLRHAITDDYDEMMYRWGRGSRVYWMSTRDVYTTFMSNDVENNIRNAQLTGIIRLVEVEWVQPISLGFWMSQFITIDYYPGETTPIINIWRAYVRAIMTNIPYENKSLREKNPYGFLVRNYAISYVGTPGDPQSYLNTAKDIRNEIYEY